MGESPVFDETHHERLDCRLETRSVVCEGERLIDSSANEFVHRPFGLVVFLHPGIDRGEQFFACFNPPVCDHAAGFPRGMACSETSAQCPQAQKGQTRMEDAFHQVVLNRCAVVKTRFLLNTSASPAVVFAWLLHFPSAVEKQTRQ